MHVCCCVACLLAGSNKSSSAVIKKEKKTNKKLKTIRSPSKSLSADASKMSQRQQQPLQLQKTKKKKHAKHQIKSLGQGAHGEQASGQGRGLLDSRSLDMFESGDHDEVPGQKPLSSSPPSQSKPGDGSETRQQRLKKKNKKPTAQQQTTALGQGTRAHGEQASGQGRPCACSWLVVASSGLMTISLPVLADTGAPLADTRSRDMSESAHEGPVQTPASSGSGSGSGSSKTKQAIHLSASGAADADDADAATPGFNEVRGLHCRLCVACHLD